jgi:hypothetical protein
VDFGDCPDAPIRTSHHFSHYMCQDWVLRLNTLAPIHRQGRLGEKARWRSLWAFFRSSLSLSLVSGTSNISTITIS